MNFVCLVFELGDKTLTLSPMENLMVKCNHVIPPSSSGRLQEISLKIGKKSSKKYHFLTKIQNLSEMNQEFSYIFYTFLARLHEVHRAFVVTSVVPVYVYVYVYVYVRVRVTLSVKVFYKSISLDHVDGSSSYFACC